MAGWSHLYLGQSLMAGAPKYSWEHGGIYSLQLWCWIKCLCRGFLLTCNTRNTNGHSSHLSSWLYLVPEVSPKIASCNARGSSRKIYRTTQCWHLKFARYPVHAGPCPCHLHLPHHGEHFPFTACCPCSSHVALNPADIIKIPHPG